MNRIAFAAIALGALSVSAAHAQAPAAAPYEIVHAGDSQMTCDGMAKEIATTAMEMQTAKAAGQEKQLADAKTADSKKAMRGFGAAMFSQAAAFGVGRLPMGALLTNPMLANGLAQAAAAGSQAIANGGATPAQAGAVTAATSAGPEQRQAYLMSLFKSKSC